MYPNFCRCAKICQITLYVNYTEFFNQGSIGIFSVEVLWLLSALVLRQSGQLYSILGKLCGPFPLRDRVPCQNNSHSTAGHTLRSTRFIKKNMRGAFLFVSVYFSSDPGEADKRNQWQFYNFLVF